MDSITCECDNDTFEVDPGDGVYSFDKKATLACTDCGKRHSLTLE